MLLKNNAVSTLTENLILQWQAQLNELVTEISWSPTGLGWAVSSAGGEIGWICERPNESNKILILAQWTGASIDCLTFSPNGQWLAAGGQSGEVLIWKIDNASLTPLLVNQINFNTWIGHLAWHPTLPHLAIGYGAQVQILDVVTAKEIITWTFDKSSVFDIAWHPSGSHLAIAGYKGVEIWDYISQPQTTAPRHRLNVQTASLKIDWSADGRYLAAGNLDQTMTIMDWQNPDDPWLLAGSPGKIRNLAWLNGSSQPCLAVATGAMIALWDKVEENWVGQLLEGHQGIIRGISAHPDHAILASAATDGSACIWTNKGEIEQIINYAVSGYNVVAWHPNQSSLAIGSQTGSIELWSRSA